MMTRILFAGALLAGWGAGSAGAQVPGPDLRDALGLAVQRFDPGHVQGLRWDDPPVRFMMAALDAVVAAEPDRTDFRRRAVEELGLHARYFHRLSMEDAGVSSREVDSVMVALTRDLSDGCPLLESEPPGTPEELEEAGSGRRLWDLSHESCRGPWSDALRAAGPFHLEWTRWGEALFGTHVALHADPARPFDVLHAVRELSRVSPALDRMLSLGTEPLPPLHLSEPIRTVQLENTDPTSSWESPFVLTYVQGWGDCPSGCIHRHAWSYRVVPSPAEGGGWTFRVQLLREEGDPLPQGR